MTWRTLSLNEKEYIVEYIPEALDDLEKLDNSVQKIVLKAISKVRQNPLPQAEGGYGKPLGNKRGNNLTNLLKIKLKKSGVRIIYSVQKEARSMKIIIVGVRSGNEVYKDAQNRVNE